MACNPDVLKDVPLFSLLDSDETDVLAQQVELKRFAPRQRIYKIGDPVTHAYVVVSGTVQVTTIDEDQQEVVVDEPTCGEFFGFASMLEQTPHQTGAVAVDEAVCIEVDRRDITTLIERKPHAGMDMLTVLGRQFHASQHLVRLRANRNANDMIEQEMTSGERIADAVAAFGGSWTFILSFLTVLVIYASINIFLKKAAWDPYPFILLNLFLSMLAAIQAPIIMMSQNRQDTKDRIRGELDFDVNRRAESEIQGVANKLNTLGDRLGDIEDLLREKLGPAQSALPSSVQ
jgi:CRP/FNR family transcriptional regulator, cyclic AMP receptor protein